MELTPSPAAAVSSLLSHYQLQQSYSSRNNDDGDRNHSIHYNLANHPSLLLKDKDKTHHASNSRERSSPNHFHTVNHNYPSTASQSDNNHEDNHATQNFHHLDQNQHRTQHHIPEPHTVASMQSSESSKFFMSSLLNLSSASAQQSSDSSLPYQGTGKDSLE